MIGKKPERKPFGREGPLKGYPKDQALYADPENWRYPIHTPWHARAARRYFDEWSNRRKYTEEEQAYIDWRINEALKKFGATPETERAARRAPRPPRGKAAEELSLRELLGLFLGRARMQRATEMNDSLVAVSKATPELIKGKVKDYVIEIDIRSRTILHDCEDWRKNADSKVMCKHLGKFLLTTDPDTATSTLRDIIKNKDSWRFVFAQK